MAMGQNVLLLDEPLSALDKNLRKRTPVDLKDIQPIFGVTTVFVTHDQGEASTQPSGRGCLCSFVPST